MNFKIIFRNIATRCIDLNLHEFLTKIKQTKTIDELRSFSTSCESNFNSKCTVLLNDFLLLQNKYVYDLNS